MSRPRRIRILGRYYALVQLDTDDLGEARVDTAQLAIKPNQDSFSEKDTVLHEVLHAIRHQQGHPYGRSVEENYVGSLATGLVSVLQDNPTFAKWLIKK